MSDEDLRAKLAEAQENFREAREISSDWSSGYRELMGSSDTQAIEFAKLIIQSLLLLHGGALVAIPTFWNTFPTVVHDKPGTVWAVFSIFVVGLVCALIAAALGFHALANRADGNHLMTSAANHNAWLHIYRMREAGGDKNLAEVIQVAVTNAHKAESEAAAFLADCTKQRASAVVLIWGSIASLILASVAGLILVSS